MADVADSRVIKLLADAHAGWRMPIGWMGSFRFG